VHMPSGDYERSLRSILHITPLLAEVLGNKSAVAVLGGFFATKKAPSVDLRPSTLSLAVRVQHLLRRRKLRQIHVSDVGYRFGKEPQVVLLGEASKP